ncbi:MAG: protein tyrosine phosphatase [Deltaproteobacteria bacterium]|nr:protein tyrosine phosphatase [Deltaproteobacteria bacterium]
MDLVDIHCHMLWGLDDGCRTPEETVEAARALASLGYTDVAPSPHAQARYAGGDAAASARRLAQARERIAEAGITLRLHGGAENPLDRRYLSLLAAGTPRGLGETQRYALVELPFIDAVPDMVAMLGQILAAGIRPIVAHPERCLEFDQPGRAAEAVRAGAALQLNLGSLTGRHGQLAYELSERFLTEGLYSVAGTDLHGPLEAADWIDEALTALEKRSGAQALRRLCSENPRRALAGDPLL